MRALDPHKFSQFHKGLWTCIEFLIWVLDLYKFKFDKYFYMCRRSIHIKFQSFFKGLKPCVECLL
jgi:hypothetical protein